MMLLDNIPDFVRIYCIECFLTDDERHRLDICIGKEIVDADMYNIYDPLKLPNTSNTIILTNIFSRVHNISERTFEFNVELFRYINAYKIYLVVPETLLKYVVSRLEYTQKIKYYKDEKDWYYVQEVFNYLQSDP